MRARITAALIVLTAMLVTIPYIHAQDKPNPKEEQFQDLCNKIQGGKAGVTEDDLVLMINLARELGRPYAAAAAAKNYAATHPAMPLRLQLMTAQNAILAADFRSAVSRYKLYLSTAVPGKASSDVAANIYVTQVDFLDAGGDAFAFMKSHGDKFRDSDLARKFDHWYLGKLQRAGDFENYVQRLTAIYAEKMPIDKENFFYSDYMDWLMNSIRRPNGNHFKITASVKNLVPLVRSDNATTTRFRFYAANLAYKADAVGKAPTEVEKLFEPVAISARTCFDASPTPETLQDILEVLSNGFNAGEWKISEAKKEEFFVYAFGKLSDPNKVEFLKTQKDRTGMFASPEQWEQLCISYPKSFADAETYLPMSSNMALYQKQTQFLAGKETVYAATVNSIANGKDFKGAVTYLIDKESWHLSFAQTFGLIQNRLWKVFKQIGGDQLPSDLYGKTLEELTRTKLLKTPMPLFDQESTRKLLQVCWQQGDKGKYAELLNGMNWVPYTEEQAKNVFEPAYKDFMAWTSKARNAATARKNAEDKIKAYKDAKARKKAAEDAKKAAEAGVKAGTAGAQAKLTAAETAWKTADKDMARFAGPSQEAEKVLQQLGDSSLDPKQVIEQVEAAFRSLMAAKSSDPAKAPTPLCKDLALATIAARDGKGEEYLAAVKKVYPLIKDYRAQKTPFGQPILAYVSGNNVKSFDVIDFQAEILADQLTKLDPKTFTGNVSTVFNAISTGRSGWPGNIGINDREKAGKICSALETSLKALVDKNQFWGPLFTWLRQTRKGSGWQNGETGIPVMTAMIEKKTLLNTDYRAPNTESAACTYMWLVKNEFQRLQDKFPSQTYFDDMYVQECTASKKLDYSYWSLGSDTQGKVINFATTMLQQYKVLPVSYSQFNKDNNLWKWHSRCLQMNKKWRAEHKVNEGTRNQLKTMLDGAFGKTRFDEFAAGSYYFVADADVSTPAGRKEFFDKLSACVDKLASMPNRLPPPAMAAMANIQDLTDAELNALIKIFPSATPWKWHPGYSYELLIPAIQNGLIEKKRYSDMLTTAPYLWKMAADLGNSGVYRSMAGFADQLKDKELFDVAATYTASGMKIAGSTCSDTVRIELQSVNTKAMHEIDATTIMVSKDDPRYPIFQAQASYMSGNYQNAKELYDKHYSKVPSMFKELDPNFCIWLIQQNTEAKDFDRANNLARAMMQWMDTLPEGFDKEVKGQLLVAYSDIAFSKQEYPRARALYERVIAAKEFEGTTARKLAELKVADVDRLSKNFDRAMERLERLSRTNDKFLQTESFYRMALIRYEQEDYTEAERLLDQVFSWEPNHVNAGLLKGKLGIQMKKFQEATDLQVGLSTAKRVLVPGKALKIDIDDKTKSIAGKKASSIEVTAWTDSGDKEKFNLFPLGDSKTKFRGELPTRLGKPAPGNHNLDLLGNDKIYYDYSEAFKKANNLEDMQMRLEVASDSILKVSSGSILTEDEEQRKYLEQLESDVDDMNFAFLDEDRSETIVRPGNPIYVRVKDFDQSVSTGPDNVTVKVTTFSGDSIGGVQLQETGPHTGLFSGSIPTASAGATAYASDYSEGKLPIYAIVQGDHGGWVGLLDNQRPKTFTVDLNDNVAADKMTITADVTGRRLKSFLLQKSMNGRDFETIGSWPAPFKAWDGSPEFVFVIWDNDDERPNSMGTISRYISTISVGKNIPRVKASLKDMHPSPESAELALDRSKIKLSWTKPDYVGHFRAAFYQPSSQTRTFKLDTKKDTRNTHYFFAIDGKQSEDAGNSRRGRGDRMLIKRRLAKGVHFIDVYVAGNNRVAAGFEILCDSEEPPYMIACPDKMFDPKAMPEIAEAIKDSAATITPNEDNTSFEVKFAPDTHLRVIKTVIADFETDAPAIKQVTLTDTAGTQVLPASAELLETGKNDTLEIVAGDSISVSYEDPKVITEGMEVQEKMMTANFDNAEITSPVYRFKPGERIDVFITDNDRDVSDKPDTIEFEVKTQTGKPIKVKAMEQEPIPGRDEWQPSEHSGKFHGVFFTTTEAPKKGNEMQVAPEESVVVVYQDKENTDPGIPWPRQHIIPQVSTEPPQLRVYEVESFPIDKQKLAELSEEALTKRKKGVVTKEEFVPPTKELTATRPMKPDYTKPVKIVSDGPLLVELTYPLIARSENDEAWIYAQTLSGRKKAGKTAEDEFDKTVPGTIRVGANPGDFPSIETPPGYLSLVVRGDPYASSALFAGRFSFVINKDFGPVPDESFALTTNSLYEQSRMTDELPPLYVQGDDQIFIGFPFKDSQGNEHWLTQQVNMDSDIFFDVMDRYYRELVQDIHVGESLYFRVNNRSADESDGKDELDVTLTTSGGFTTNVTLIETFQHTGNFKGVAKPVYKNDPLSIKESSVVPVDYGEEVTVTYDTGNGPLSRKIAIRKGADGDVVPFTKRFKDPEMAMQTQFLVAEAFFELAKKHRDLEQESLARREISQGKKLLMEAIRDFPDSETKVQADYLLADLALEFANDAQNEDIQKQNYLDAINGFSEIVTSFPDNPYAPKAQYKKALAFEKMGDIDKACEEYVKLSYTYPDSEFIAQTIARLGGYFAAKGKDLEAKIKETKDERIVEKLETESKNMFRTAAQVFGRLAPRFPTHELAGKTMVLSGQCYMRAEEYEKATETLEEAIVKTKDQDNDLTAEAMYWRGDAFFKANNFRDAYREFRKLTWDYPSTKWAKYARGRLTSPELQEFALEEAEQ